MNKYKSLILTLGLAGFLGMTSCSESFLDITSKTESNTENFYKTEKDAWRALIGCYDGWRRVMSTDGPVTFLIASNILSDETLGGGGVGDGSANIVLDHFDTSYGPGQQTIFTYDWKLYYAGIYRCNELITRAEQIKWESEETKGLYLGEARAIRAIMYFDLVRLFGNIPLFLEPSSENRAQADPAEVYAHIFDDLQYAIANIPADKNISVDDHGRITRYAAEAIMARAYLYYSGYYGKEPGFTPADGETIGSVTKADALAAVTDIITSGKYGLIDDFKDLWPAASLVPIPGELGWAEGSSYAGDANKEVILAMKFFPTYNYPSGEDNYALQASNRLLVNMGMRNFNDCPPYGKGWGVCTVTPEFLEMFENGDKRLAPSVIDMEGEGIASKASFEACYLDWRNYTGYSNKKYTPIIFGNGSPFANAEGTLDFMINNPEQFVMVRYADVLLMAAELGAPQGATYLNNIRKRAGLGEVALTQKNIMDERARELAFEGLRYWDLLRQGVDVMADAVCASGGKIWNGGVETTNSYVRSKIVATKGLQQIPQDQITLSNGVLVQNEGWR